MMVGVRAWCALLALVVIACGASSDNRMSVTQPQELRGQIDEQPSLFGMPTYGRSLRGQIFWSSNRDDRAGCKPIQQTPNNPNHNPIVYMFERGGCTFVTKVRHAQDAGATAVIVKNDGDGPLPHMSNDGSGMSIVIPSMIIKKSAGDKITNWAEQHPDAFIEVSIEYGLPESDVVDYRLWTSSMDPQAFEFKLNFRDIAKALEKKARFDVRYFFVSGKSYGCDKGDVCGNQCTNSGKYCAVDPDHDLNEGVSGAQVVQENLREMCIFQQAKSGQKEYLWWAYVNEFRTKCASVNTVDEACSKSVVEKIDGLSWNGVHDCVQSSGGSDQTSGTNSMIEAELKAKEDDGVYLLPTLIVNGVTYYGSLSCPMPLDLAHCGVLKTMCTAYTNGLEPAVCSPSKGCELGKTRDACDRCNEPGSPDFMTDPESCEHDGGASVGTIIVLIVILAAILIAAAIVYHQHTSNKMRDELRSIMAQYVPLEGDGHSANEHTRFV
ncbi:PA domain-containing protein [Plasmodiophora brassicae]